MQALMQATLEVDDLGCVYARRVGDDERASLVWGYGYTVDGDRTDFVIRDADGVVVAHSGTTLGISGGYIHDVTHGWNESDCATGSVWITGEIDA
jgi:hypothetical protein